MQLSPSWQMQRVASDDSLTPVPATLLSQAEQVVNVQSFQSVPVVYDFHLGQAAIDLGIDVDEGISSGYDGKIYPTLYGEFSVSWTNGGSNCCYPSVAAVLAAFPDKQIQQP